MPTEILFSLVVVMSLIGSGLLAGAFVMYREYREEQRNPVQGWDETPTGELAMWNAEDQRERETCLDCKGRRCYDYKVNKRGCGTDPTEATGDPAHLIGRHFRHSVVTVSRNWWPFPRTRSGRVRPDLWKRVAGHCQIALSRPLGTVLP